MQKGFKVDDFYAARSGPIPPLPWPSIPPPFSDSYEEIDKLNFNHAFTSRVHDEVPYYQKYEYESIVNCNY